MEKARLEDDLAKKLANRPDPQTLIEERILNRMISNLLMFLANIIADENPTEEPKD